MNNRNFKLMDNSGLITVLFILNSESHWEVTKSLHWESFALRITELNDSIICIASGHLFLTLSLILSNPLKTTQQWLRSKVNKKNLWFKK
jgi:hypothetical protein